MPYRAGEPKRIEDILVLPGGIDDVPRPRARDLERAKQLVDPALAHATSHRR